METKQHTKNPGLSIRTTPELSDAARTYAAATGVSIGRVVRDALRLYLAVNANTPTTAKERGQGGAVVTGPEEELWRCRDD